MHTPLLAELADPVSTYLDSLTRTRRDVRRLAAPHRVLLAEPPSGRPVAVCVGGGAGHEPFPAGYVGAGCVDACVVGPVFASPPVADVLAAIEALARTSPAVVLLVINYTGDMLNFGAAAQAARAKGIGVELVRVADDVALVNRGDGELSAEQWESRRGLAGVAFVAKLAGAAAAAGRSLAEVAAVARHAASRSATLGLALSPPTVEIGLGMHGEPGRGESAYSSGAELIATLAASVLRDLDVRPGDSVVALLNSLGTVCELELHALADRLAALLVAAPHSANVAGLLVGRFATSIRQSAFSLTVFKLGPPSSPMATQFLELLNAPTSAPAWSPYVPLSFQSAPRVDDLSAAAAAAISVTSPRHAELCAAIARVPQLLPPVDLICAALEKNETLLAELDAASGDGDLGESMKRFAHSLQAALAPARAASTATSAAAPAPSTSSAPTVATSAPTAAAAESALFALAGAVCAESVGGSMGAILAAGFTAAAGSDMSADSSVARLESALKAMCAAITEVGGAVAGDRTLLDALLPAVGALNRGVQRKITLNSAMRTAAAAAEGGALATASLVPKRGRARYVGERCLGSKDGGAVAVALALRAVCLPETDQPVCDHTSHDHAHGHGH